MLLTAYPNPLHIQCNIVNICTYKSNICALYVVFIEIKLTVFLCSLVFACVRCVDLSTIFYEWRYYAFWKCVITPFKKALLRLSTSRYNTFFALLRLLKGVITPFNFFSLRNLILIHVCFRIGGYHQWDNFSYTTAMTSQWIITKYKARGRETH